VQPDQGTLLGQAITGAAVLIIGGFIGYKIIRAIAAFVDALQGVSEPTSADKDKEEDQ